MKCLANAQKHVRLRGIFLTWKKKIIKINGVVVSPVNVMTSIVIQNCQIIEPLTEKT